MPKVDSRPNCLLCGKALTERQRGAGNHFCGQACGYRFQLWLREQATYRTPLKRYRRMGIVRPFVKIDGELVGLQGPGRRQKLSVYVYEDDSPPRVSCRGCARPLELEGVDAWCDDCLALTTLDAPFEVSARAA